MSEAVAEKKPDQPMVPTKSVIPPGLSQNEITATLAVKSGNYKGLTFPTAMMILQLAEEIGIPMAQALGSMHIVEGKLVMSAPLIGSLIQRSGRFRYKIRENTDKACTIEFLERLGERDGLVVWDSLGCTTWTIEMAQRAGLAQKTVWLRYPEAMLFSRAITQGCRMFCPSLTVVAVYDPDEAEAFDRGGPNTYRHTAPPREDDFKKLAAETAKANIPEAVLVTN